MYAESWKLFALGIQSLGWNHGELIAELFEKFHKRNPFTLVEKQLLSLKEQNWLEEWRLFVEKENLDHVEQEGERWGTWARDHGWTCAVLWEEAYPVRFKEELDFPVAVWSTRPLILSEKVKVAVVGSREASAYGMFACSSLVEGLVREYGCEVISGTARGIDTSAHKATLRAGGMTFGFVGSGALYVPHWKQEMFAKNGCLISIFPPNAQAQKWHFLQRNRYMSRLSDGVLVVEAGLKSGTLITAHCALEHGRPLLAVTHPITSPNWGGVRELIQMGAEVVATAGECMEVIAPDMVAKSSRERLREEVLAGAQTEVERTLLAFLFERGGMLLESDFPQVEGLQKGLVSLLERGVISRQAGVVHLSCMIQS